MAVKIRLRRMGARKKPFFRVVVADSRMPRDGRFITTLGYYDPTTEPVTLKLDEDKVLEWLRCGAQPSNTVRSLLRKMGIMERFAQEKQKSQGE